MRHFGLLSQCVSTHVFPIRAAIVAQWVKMNDDDKWMITILLQFQCWSFMFALMKKTQNCFTDSKL